MIEKLCRQIINVKYDRSIDIIDIFIYLLHAICIAVNPL